VRPPLLEIRNLSVTYRSTSETIRAVRNISLRISEGETLALVGETGSGKSTVAHATLGLLDPAAQVDSGEILFEGRPLQSLTNREWKEVRSRKIGMVFQDVRGALNPVLSIETHLIETLRAHQPISRKAARARALELLKEVGIPKGQEKLHSFELSGGACQRVGIALAICNSPQLLIADEPTSAVDSIFQAQILDLLQFMKQRHGLALLIISHDLPLISQIADRIAIMYHGRIVESGFKDEVFASPAHPYTRGLMQSQPDLSHQYDTHRLSPIPGSLPSPSEESAGCAFAPRCNMAEPPCTCSAPAERSLSATHWVACIRHSNNGESSDHSKK
jgi:peptide/nickel transport system ATP-binding protein